ncbi:hypothetical protein J40TS1_13590 [Paenibacillus montaniterrae]|uniref:Class I SAM-dependent methyltransferase n=1 Tax=Paenibacillus montaniterrae TaxID=429341 RepID=A0A919YM33_9BACL|nr:class I SAM-dependent methyltransferase [Paenibacillus montaniterrae]GIP15717.1 hypothetical protein J40TS1_13590 [Paenibacillus montaniterrae]
MSLLFNWHHGFILELARIVQPKVYVELGIYTCQLFNSMIPYAEQLVGVDIDSGAGSHMQDLPKTRFFHGTTQQFAEELQKQPLAIDLLFIDADHSKEAVLEDFRSFFPYVVPHGLILLHDTHPGSTGRMDPRLCGTAYQAIEELARETDAFEMMTIPVDPGLTLCRKRKQQLSWHES